jgi:uncharacterized coiled-coil protein SlyX
VQLGIREAVSVDSRGQRTLSDRPIIATLVNAANDQQLLIEKQQAELQLLQEEVSTLKSAMARENKTTDVRLKAL